MAFLGNCQVQSFAQLASLMIEDVSTLTFDYSTPEAHDEATGARFADQLESCDIIFTQRASERFRHTNDPALRARFPSKTVVIGNFYFRGLFPDSCYVGAFGSRFEIPSAVNSVILLDAFRRGLSVDAAVRAHGSIAAYERLGLFEAWRSSMDEMHRREAEGVLDVPAAEMMEAACRRYPAFLTMNHPSIALLSEYLAAAFRFAGLAFRPVNAAVLADPLFVHDTSPIADVVAAHYNLPYRVSQCWKINSLNGRFIGIDELAARFYEAYAGADPTHLLVHSPGDMVERLAADPARAFLVSADSAPPATEMAEAAPSGGSHPVRSLHASLELAQADGRQSLALLKRLHSYADVMDTKVERLSVLLPLLLSRLEDLQKRLPPHLAEQAALAQVKRRVTKFGFGQALLTALVLLACLGLGVEVFALVPRH